MVIAGLGGHAREVVDVLGYEQAPSFHFFEEFETGESNNWGFEINKVTDAERLRAIFTKDPYFVIAVGNPVLRQKFYTAFCDVGGKPFSVIASTSIISKNNVELGEGLNIMHLSFISSKVRIGNGTLVNCGVKIHHDSIIGDFCEISPNAIILGGCKVGNNCSIGSSATILPKVSIGNNVIIGAGSVVTKDIPDNMLAYGVPARVMKSRTASEHFINK